MKAKPFKELGLPLLIMILLGSGIALATSRVEGIYPAGSVLSNAGAGYSGFYKSLKQTGFSVSQTVDPPESLPETALQIIYSKELPAPADPLITEWVSKGGTAVIIMPDAALLRRYKAAEPIRDLSRTLTTVPVGKGRLVFAEADDYRNIRLLKTPGAPYPLVHWLQAQHVRALTFNEYLLYPDGLKDSLWNAMPLWSRLVLAQLFLALCGWFWLKGQRFGKPTPFTEETERTEFEYLHSAAWFYRQARCWDRMVRIYFHSLLRMLRKGDSEWLEYWVREDLPDAHTARLVEQAMKKDLRTLSPAEASKLILHIDQLKKHISQRRKSFGIHRP